MHLLTEYDSRRMARDIAEAVAKTAFFAILSELLIVTLPLISPVTAAAVWCVWFPLVMWITFYRHTHEEFFLGLRARAKHISLDTIAYGAILTCAYCVASVILEVLYVSLVGGPESTSDIEMTLYQPGGWLPFLLIVVFLAPVVEEAGIRGYFQGRLEAAYGKRMALCCGAMLFSLLHLNIVAMPFYFIDGLILGFVAMRTGSIWISTAMHASGNLALVLLSLRFGASASAADFPRQIGVPLSAFFLGFGGLAGLIAWLLSRPSMRRAEWSPAYGAVAVTKGI